MRWPVSKNAEPSHLMNSATSDVASDEVKSTSMVSPLIAAAEVGVEHLAKCRIK